MATKNWTKQQENKNTPFWKRRGHFRPVGVVYFCHWCLFSPHIRESGFRNQGNFACGVRNPECWALNCRIQRKEPGIQVPPTKNPDQLPGIRNPQRQNPRLSWFLLMGWHVTHDKYPGGTVREWNCGAFNADVRAYLNERWKERHICVYFLLKTPMETRNSCFYHIFFFS